MRTLFSEDGLSKKPKKPWLCLQYSWNFTGGGGGGEGSKKRTEYEVSC